MSLNSATPTLAAPHNVMGFAICRLQENATTQARELICLSMNDNFLTLLGKTKDAILLQNIQLEDYDLFQLLDKKDNSISPFYKKNLRTYRIEILRDSIIENQYTIVTEDISAYVNMHETEHEASLRFAKENFQILIKSSPIPMLIATKNGLIDTNDAAVELLGFESIEELLQYNLLGISPGMQPNGKSSQDAFDEVINRATNMKSYSFEWTYMKKDGTLLISENTVNISEVNGVQYFNCTIKDVTDVRLAQEKILQEQQRMIDALSIPITPIFKKILLLPLIGNLTEKRVHLVIQSALEKIGATQSKVLILDVSGANDIDINIAARQFRKLAAATKLMGCVTILSGMPPLLAQGLISLNLDLSQILSLNNLQAALHEALLITKYEGINLSALKNIK